MLKDVEMDFVMQNYDNGTCPIDLLHVSVKIFPLPPWLAQMVWLDTV